MRPSLRRAANTPDIEYLLFCNSKNLIPLGCVVLSTYIKFPSILDPILKLENGVEIWFGHSSRIHSEPLCAS